MKTNELSPQHKARLKANYEKLLKSGMFWEVYPELTGEWEKDKYTMFKDLEIKNYRCSNCGGEIIINNMGYYCDECGFECQI